MDKNRLLHKAISLAVKVHGEQKDKAGSLYILHPLHVMDSVDDIDAKIVAVLHDVVEDCNVEIRRFDPDIYCIHEIDSNNTWEFPKHIVEAIIAITKYGTETNREYYERIKVNPLALKVKFADIAHNSSTERLAVLSVEEQNRLREKYAKALRILKE